MLTRKRAKEVGLQLPSVWEQADQQQPDSSGQTSIDALSDLSLTEIFSFLRPDELVCASQVCRRWLGLSPSRRLWSRARLTAPKDDEAAFLAVVRTLRRARCVLPYVHVEVCATEANEPTACFKDNGKRLVLTVFNAFRLRHCLLELVKPQVTQFRFTEQQGFAMTVAEAFGVWEAIAAMDGVDDLRLVLQRTGRLFSSRYRFRMPEYDNPQQQQRGGSSSSSTAAASVAAMARARVRGRLASFQLRLEGPHAKRVAVCQPIKSLLRARGCSRYLYIEAEDQQPLLKLCSWDLDGLMATLLPSVVGVLSKLPVLRCLSALGSRHGRGDLRVLRDALSLDHVRRNLLQLDVWLDSWDPYDPAVVGQGGGGEDDADAGSGGDDDSTATDWVEERPDECEAALGAVAACSGLTWLSLSGFGALLRLADRGPRALRELLAGLARLEELTLSDVAPCGTKLLDACERLATADVASAVPKSLRLVRLEAADPYLTSLRRPLSPTTPVTAAPCGHSYHYRRDGAHRHEQQQLQQREGARGRFEALRRLLHHAPWLHVEVKRANVCPALAHLPGHLLVLPHALDDYCKNCPMSDSKKAGATVRYFKDLEDV